MNARRLRPQLLDRFGLCVKVGGIPGREERVLVMERRVAYDEDPEAFTGLFDEDSSELVKKIKAARDLYPRVEIARERLYDIADSAFPWVLTATGAT